MDDPAIKRMERWGYPKPYIPNETDDVVEAVRKALARFSLTQDIPEFVVSDWVTGMIEKYKETEGLKNG